jgi:uncharacterized membrane protein YedE/YeeE
MIFPYTIVAYLVAIVILFATGAIVGYRYEAKRFDTYQQQVAAEAKAQEALTREKEKENDETVQNVAAVYSGELTRASAALDRLRHQPASGSGLPGVAIGSKVFNGTGIKLGTGCESSPADPCTVTRAEFNGAVNDAIAIATWQEWVRSLRFPTE